jgi:methyltransferase family protein
MHRANMTLGPLPPVGHWSDCEPRSKVCAIANRPPVDRRALSANEEANLDMEDSATIDCRLCGGPCRRVFTQTILHKYRVAYYRCDTCSSLQTQDAYWLEEAYATNLSGLDTGAAQRNISNLAICFFISKLYNLKDIIDFGGGDGLLCRFLRDYGLNCFVKDKYATPTYAQGFTEPDFQDPDLVIAFEVLEHFANPGRDLDSLFSLKPRVLFASTGIYTDEQGDWWYLAPETGQHVFFYSRKALDLIAEKYGYGLLANGDFVLFVRPDLMSNAKSVLTRLMLKGAVIRLLRSLIVFLPAPYAWNDHLLQKKNAGPSIPRFDRDDMGMGGEQGEQVTRHSDQPGAHDGRREGRLLLR